MQLTRYTDYSLRVLIYLALLEPGTLATNKIIARHFNIPLNHLIKVVHNLSKLGLIHSVRGKGGGITLAKTPEQIQLGTVIQKLEPAHPLIDCTSPLCPLLEQKCGLKTALDTAQDCFIATLNRYTLKDILDNMKTQLNSP